MKKHLIISVLLLWACTTFAQTDEPIAMGKWRTHLAYDDVTQIAQTRENVFAISRGALFSINKEDPDDQNFYSKISGLSDVFIVRIEYDEANNQLLIIYKNGNIDIMHSAGVNNIPDLHNKQMSSGKGVNHVFFKGDSAYFSCDFGVLLLNMKRKEISDTYIIGANASELRVLATTIYKDNIYALTTNSIYKADVKNPNLVNYEFWKNVAGLPGSGEYQHIFTFSDKLFLIRNNELFLMELGGTWIPLLDKNITTINVSKEKLILGDGSSNLTIINTSLQKSEISIVNSTDVEYDSSSNTYWLAGTTKGLISYNATTSNLNYHKPIGPATNRPWDITFAGEKMFMVAGGRWAGQYGFIGQVMIYENNKWTGISGNSITAITQKPALDFVNVAVDPKDHNHFFVTSFGSGLFEFKGNQFYYWHNPSNSALTSAVAHNPDEYTRLDGAVFDKDNNLLIANMMTNFPIKILSSSGEWSQLDFPAANHETLGKIVISNLNDHQKWVLSIRKTPGVFIWDDSGLKGEGLPPYNNRFFDKFADTDNVGSFIAPTYYYCLAQDKNGVFWVGTDSGPLLFYNPAKVFEPDYTCTRVKIPRNDGTELADYLLQNEKIKAIAIDGANRKWLGTETSGLYLMSENGQETIQHFTSKNSPLLSDDIMSIAINPVSGEVFIGTSNGLISYQSDAAESSGAYSNVYAYPNPVRENYNGIITITGLVANTQVKITDLNGNLIYQTVSNGSVATWDGKDVHGRKVSTGIYMAICANQDGTQNTITKIMVIN